MVHLDFYIANGYVVDTTDLFRQYCVVCGLILITLFLFTLYEYDIQFLQSNIFVFIFTQGKTFSVYKFVFWVNIVCHLKSLSACCRVCFS